MTNRRALIERVLTGVLRQAFEDAGTRRYTVEGSGPATAFASALCNRAGAEAGAGLRVNAASKTALLLGDVPDADVLPFGDLYHTELVALIGAHQPGVIVMELAALCGGAETLDETLRRFYDQRSGWDAAAALIPPNARPAVKARLDAARFQRLRVGLVPKLGARTLGIDLFA